MPEALCYFQGYPSTPVTYIHGSWMFMVLRGILLAHFLFWSGVGWPVWGADALLAVRHARCLTSRTRQLQGRTTKPILRDFLQNADFEKGTSRWLTSDQVPIHAVLKTTILTCIMLYIEGLQAHKTAKLYHSAEHSSMVLWNYILILLYLSFYTLHCHV